MLFNKKFISGLLAVCFIVMLAGTAAVGTARAGDFETEGATLGIITSVPRTMTYQGVLRDSEGQPVNDILDITFRLFNVEIGGTHIWLEMVSDVSIIDGNFTAILGEIFPLDLSFDTDYWISLQVEGDVEMEPRLKLHMVPYSARTDTSDYAIVGGGWIDDGMVVRLETITDSVGIGTSIPSEILDVDGTAQMAGFKMPTGASPGFVLTSNGIGVGTWQEASGASNWSVTDSVLYTNNYWGLARGDAENFLHGNDSYSHVNFGVRCTTGTSGLSYENCTVGGGLGNTASHRGATVGGGWRNNAKGAFSTVGGGYQDTASGERATVAGGSTNKAGGYAATVGGGTFNTANGEYSIIGGGEYNIASFWYATVGGGMYNTANGGYYPTVGGGRSNAASGNYATVGGGGYNTASGLGATVGGGYGVTVAADYTFAFGRDFTTSTPNAVIFHNSVDDIRVGIGTTNPTSELTVQGSIEQNDASGNTLCLIAPTMIGHGSICTYDSEGDTLCLIVDTFDESGAIGTYGPNGNVNIMLSDCGQGLANNGWISVMNDDGDVGAAMHVRTLQNEDAGVIFTTGNNNETNVTISNLAGNFNHGCVSVDNDLGNAMAEMQVCPHGSGRVLMRGSDESLNITLDHLNINEDHGAIHVYDGVGGGGAQAGMFVNNAGQGVVYGDILDFPIANPDQQGTDICYASPAGPEAAAYIRGTGHLFNGMAEVTFPEHFKTVVNPEGITVQLTPLSTESKGLAAVEKSPDRLVVRELGNGEGTYDFDYMIMAVRKGHEDYQVIRPALEVHSDEAEASIMPSAQRVEIETSIEQPVNR